MQLTRLEIKGFKSFADKVIINFDKGITGIVGPNGCGKSNVVDAIRWVLGEQKTRVLRSEKMENIIFNGTKDRKPTQLAEVSLTFDNTKNLIPTEYSQVTITRKYFRSGESEYQLNGLTCRLKDITNLFLDTGIASNTYAIIELKMVDDLLNDKDNSRRALFEEAAGISKFKIRKKETLKKLQDTDADLDRVEDLIFEIDKNLKSLEKQAKQAKRYYELKDEYKQTSIVLSKKTIKSHQEVFGKIQEEIQLHSDKRIAINTQVSEQDALLEKQKTNLISKEKLLASRQKTLNEHVNKIRQYESEKKIKSERQRYLQEKINQLANQISIDKQSNERSAFSIKSLETEKELAKSDFTIIEEKLKTAAEILQQKKNGVLSLQEQVNESSSTFLNSKESVYKFEKDLEIKQIQINTLRQELEKNSSDVSKNSLSLEEYSTKIQEMRNEKERMQKMYDAIKVMQDENDEKSKFIESQNLEWNQKLTAINRSIDAKQNEYNLTKSLVENLEGFPEAIKFLKKQTNWKSTPLLSDIIACPEEYRICIENYLENYMNYYVVQKSNDAVTAINLLHDASKGKANFFVLDLIDDHTQEAISADKSFVRATDIISYDIVYQKLISNLLGNVLIYEKEKPTLSGDNLVYLEKSGKIIHRKQSVSGGSVGLFEGKRIGRAKNLEILFDEIKSLSKQQEKLHQQLSQSNSELIKLKQLDKKNELDSIKEEINRFNENYISIQSKQEQFISLIQSNTLKNEDIESRILDLTDEIENIKPNLIETSNNLSLMEEAFNERKGLLIVAQDELTDASSFYNELNVNYHQKLNKLESVTKEINYKEESYNHSLDRIQVNQDELKKVEKDLHDLVVKNNTNDDDLISMYEEKESIELGVNEAEKLYYETRSIIDDSDKIIRELQRQKETTDSILMEWQNKLTETKLALNSIKERLAIEFNLNFEGLDSEIPQGYEDKSEVELKEQVSRLKNRMDAIGPINPMAMEAYEEIKERYDFIIAQKEDLMNAKNSLMTTINEIDTVAKETFLNSFNAIKSNFIKVFRTLFTDQDDCDLYLTDPENPLESPIDIIAKPKGKRPLTINQLSGGEKTLTATSLLFAIYLLKPAPFCIFDEVDAPLDDANIDKFNQIIREFSNDSQFIIVTHNKRTMSSTDIIYGITMIEQGVSRVVPVDLRELA